MIPKPACLGKPESWFFPAAIDAGRGGGRRHTNLYALGRAVCDSCPIRGDCLETAMKVERGGAQYRQGMFGGLTPKERAVLEDRRSLTPTIRACLPS